MAEEPEIVAAEAAPAAAPAPAPAAEPQRKHLLLLKPAFGQAAGRIVLIDPAKAEAAGATFRVATDQDLAIALPPVEID